MKNCVYIFFYCVFFTSNLWSQKLPDLSDSILIYKYSNSVNYQLIQSKDSALVFYYADSTVKAKGAYHNVTKKRNGNWSSFYPNGTIQTFGYITDSSFYGKWKFYYPNGQQKAKGKFKLTPDDKDSSLLVLKMSDRWKFWNENGKLLAKINYSTTLKTTASRYGKFKEKYESGQTKITGEYYKGAKIGTWTHYYESGKKQLTAYYVYNSEYEVDYPVGRWSYFNENGTLIKIEVYKKGVLIETIPIK